MKSFVLVLFFLTGSIHATESPSSDRCSPKGYDICESGKSWAEGLTRLAPRLKKEHPDSDINMERAEAKGTLVTIYISIRYTRAELEKVQEAKGQTIDAYMGMLDSAAHRSNCAGPPLSLIAYGGIFRNVYSFSDGERLTEVTISDCSAYVKD